MFIVCRFFMEIWETSCCFPICKATLERNFFLTVLGNAIAFHEYFD